MTRGALPARSAFAGAEFFVVRRTLTGADLDALTVAPETVTSSFTTLAFLALLRVLIKLFFWMDTVDSPRSNFFFRPTPTYIAWRVPNCAKPVLALKNAKNIGFSHIPKSQPSALHCENSPRVKN
jgi:hypothetical protein